MGASTLPCAIQYVLLITTAHQWWSTSLAVSDKCILSWRSIIWSGLLGCHIWYEVQSIVSQQLSALPHAWCAGKQKLPAAWQMSGRNCLSSKISQPHSLSPLAAWKPHQCRRWLKLTRKNVFIRNQWWTSMNWSSIWLKYGQQPAELHSPSSWSVATLTVSQSQKQTEHLLQYFYLTVMTLKHTLLLLWTNWLTFHFTR